LLCKYATQFEEFVFVFLVNIIKQIAGNSL
jgi:hypothetical protein